MRYIDADTQLCGIIGNPVGHSFSPAIHNAAFEALDLNYVYLAFEVREVGPILAAMRTTPSFRGLSVTIPHKSSVIDHLDEVGQDALQAGSINTITHTDGRLVGTTTDGLGTLRAFEAAGIPLADKRVLFTGSGGAVRGVAFAFAEHTQAEKITILGRTASKVDRLIQDLRSKTPAIVDSGDLEHDIERAVASHDVIVQGTPVGMHPHDIDQTCIPANSLRKEHVVFDMVYRPARTRLLRDAEQVGATTILGIEMLLHQAALQFESWTGQAAPLDVMRSTVADFLAP